jgi:hypothetical protein
MRGELRLVLALLTTTAGCVQRVHVAEPVCHSDPSKESEKRPSDAELARLIQDVTRENRTSIEVAFASRHLLDGGNLEDLDQALGLVADKAPHLFLSEALRHCYSSVQIKGIVTALPLDATDDAERQKRIAKTRIGKLGSVSDPALLEEREYAIAALRDLLNLLESVPSDTVSH